MHARAGRVVILSGIAVYLLCTRQFDIQMDLVHLTCQLPQNAEHDMSKQNVQESCTRAPCCLTGMLASMLAATCGVLEARQAACTKCS
jgi:hypothetical protein